MAIPFFIIVSGPTAVGKTALVDDLAQQLLFSLEVINADTGQLYTPLSVGTAKPDLSSQKVPHHLFDELDEPRDFTVTEYRAKVRDCMESITQKGAVPVIVGGSSFYLATLFYPPVEPAQDTSDLSFADEPTERLWQRLYTVDPDRAEKLHKNDRYRIIRALKVWYQTGIKPSLQEPSFDPLGRCAFYFLTRERDELHERINQRVKVMLEQGWLDEVGQLSDEWHEFLLTKKLIGYPDIIMYLCAQQTGELPDEAYEQLVEKIAQRTRGYAKRQITFWRGLKKRLERSDPERDFLLKIEEHNLTLSPYDLYLKQLTAELDKLYRKAKK